VHNTSMDNKAYEKLLGRALFYLGIRMRSEHEMRTYLQQKAADLHVNQENIEAVILRLKELKYLDDSLFVTALVSARTRSKPKGEYALRRELSNKGVGAREIDTYFETQGIDEEGLALEALTMKWERMRQLPRPKRMKRATDFLARRGFSFDSIRNALDKAEQTL